MPLIILRPLRKVEVALPSSLQDTTTYPVHISDLVDTLMLWQSLFIDGNDMRVVFEIGPTLYSLETAIQLADTSKEANADAVKVQMLNPDDLLINKDLKFDYLQLNEDYSTANRSELLYDILERRYLTDNEWEVFFNHCSDIGISVFATVTNHHYIALARSLGAKELKIASADITYLDLIEGAARTGLPVHLDTGRASLNEISEAIGIVKANGSGNLVVHYCPPGYPASIEDVHLEILTFLREEFNVAVGYSDHSPGVNFNIVAIALGADIIEKTLTFSRTSNGPEHMFSIEVSEAKSFVETLRSIDFVTQKRSSNITELFSENPSKLMRRSLYASRDVEVGATLQAADVVACRPGTYLEPSELTGLLGRVTNQRIAKGSPLRLELFS